MKILLSLLFLSHFFLIFSQKNIVNQNHEWVSYTGFHTISSKISVLTEYQWRRTNGFQNWQQSVLRFGFDYALNPCASVMVGYGWIKTFPYGSQPVLHEFNENRIFQQLNLKHKIACFEIQHRYRSEQRFLEQYFQNNNMNITQIDPVFRNRIRYRAMVMLPLFRRELKENTLFLNVNNEIFIGFGKGIAKNPLDQNRFIAALGWRFNAQTNVQVGYLNQLVIKPNAIDFERNHTGWISINYNLDFTKLFDKR